MEKKPILAVIGGQYGSEAKGTVVEQIGRERNVEYAVRTGAINAGHSFMYKGKKYKMQTIPCGWTNPNTKLVIGAGAYIYMPLLLEEVALIKEATGEDVRKRLFIDKRAGLHTDEHHKIEREKKLHESMGSTGEGCAEAAIEKMRRSRDYTLFSMTSLAKEFQIVDTVKLLNDAYDEGKQILLEGTQGTMLDFHTGNYPYVTSRQTFVSGWLAEAGLSPKLKYEVIMVVRAFPIRVAGNSGKFSNELSWVEFARELNSKSKEPVVAEAALQRFEDAMIETSLEMGLPNHKPEGWDAETRATHSEKLSAFHQTALKKLDEPTFKELSKLFELTTVTKKLRRIARMNWDELRYACMLNRPDSIALMFLNYVDPSLATAKTWEDVVASEGAGEFIRKVTEETGVGISYVNVSQDGVIKVPEL